MKFKVVKSVSREIVMFDRQFDFAGQAYRLSAVKPGQLIGQKKPPRKK